MTIARTLNCLMQSAVPPCKHFNQDCNFANEKKFTLIETLHLINVSSDLKIQRLKESADFWIKKFKRLIHYGLNHELNFAKKSF